MTGSCLYFGDVLHTRLRPFRHRFRYRVFSLLLDIDALPTLHQQLRLFSHNRFNLFSFFDRDHGALGDAGPRPSLRVWVERQLTAAGFAPGGRIELFCFPRVLGYVFNPLSVFYCYSPAGDLAAVLYEVNNTFGQRHSYLLPVRTDRGANRADPIDQTCAKRLYVSPFIGMEATYRFRLTPPGERFALMIRQDAPEGRQLVATHIARRRALTDAALALAFVRFPLMTLKVVGGIHWEALKLWRKGARLVPRPAAPANAATFTDAAGHERPLLPNG